ncbi:hypothetical protein BT96DRAFT_925722 [Gymnopus androsaceus JB14]|uniref:Uncharacterized protein n=1 Tax=Gymnopus androsaceus JB14 TaxID=1447944 RepID=A0A6A4H070_9AGAR|nr:hypothetical protein BT96DRAFT_925722 [Gymnopus androsaceus JB14]
MTLNIFLNSLISLFPALISFLQPISDQPQILSQLVIVKIKQTMHMCRNYGCSSFIIITVYPKASLCTELL